MSERTSLAGDEAGRVPASGVYILYLLAPFTGGLVALPGAIWAFVARAKAAGPPRAHLSHQLGLFWLGLVLAAPIWMLSLIGEIPILGVPFGVLGWALGGLLALWWLWRSLTGLKRVAAGRPPKG